MADPVSVRGGAGGIEAQCDDLVATGALFTRAAGDVGETALRLHGYLVHPDVLAAAVFDPAGAAWFEGSLASALDGPAGVSVWALRCAATGTALRGAAFAYLGADRLDEAVSPFTSALTRLPEAGAGLVATYVRTQDAAAAAEQAIIADPALTDVGLDAMTHALAAGSIQQAAGLLGCLYPDGRARVQPQGTDAAGDAAGPPRSLADVVGGLSRRNDGRPGEVDVRMLTSGSGRRRVLVDIPGTKDWSLAPGNRNITSIVTNLRGLAGVSTSYERGVIEAMRRAGVRAGDDVMLVGHSEGGMVAVNAAIHLAGSREFHVTHVVTAGAPVGAATRRVPRSVEVLALENEGDLVPHLDGAENPDRSNVTTVRLSRNQGGMGANHDLAESYQPGAADVDASADRSIRAFLGGAHGFLSATAVRTSTYQVTRQL